MNSNAISNLKSKSIIKVVKALFIIFLCVYLLLCFFIHFFLESVILWLKQQQVDVAALSIQEDKLEELELTMSDGNISRGWFLKNSNSDKANLLIYFGGNAEELSGVITKMAKLDDWSVGLINYRGYGASEGTADETVLYSDTLEIYDYLADREDVDKRNIVVMGRSIGTGVATYLAEKRDVSAVILSTPYDTLASVIQKKCPIIPASLIFSHKYDSIGRAPNIKRPLLILAASEDVLIPNWHSKRLKEAWAGTVSYQVLAGEDHNSIDDTEEYWNSIREFLSTIEH